MKRNDNVKINGNRSSKNRSSITGNALSRPEKRKVSFETNGKDRRLIDVSELQRVYGELKTPAQSENGSETTAEALNDNSQDASLTNNENPKIITLLETHVSDLKQQLADSTAEKNKLLELADRLQKQNEVLMLPPTRSGNIITYFKNWFTPVQPQKDTQKQ